MPDYDNPTTYDDDPGHVYYDTSGLNYEQYLALIDNDTIRVVNDGTREYIDLPASVVNDLTTSFNDRAAFNEYVNAIDPPPLNINVAARREYDQHDLAPRYNDPTQVLYNGDDGYFQFQYITDLTPDDDGVYHVDSATLNEYGIRARDHGGVADYYVDSHAFDHNPLTCGNGCRPRTTARLRDRPRRPRRNRPRVSFATTWASTSPDTQVIQSRRAEPENPRVYAEAPDGTIHEVRPRPIRPPNCSMTGCGLCENAQREYETRLTEWQRNLQ